MWVFYSSFSIILVTLRYHHCSANEDQKRYRTPPERRFDSTEREGHRVSHSRHNIHVYSSSSSVSSSIIIFAPAAISKGTITTIASKLNSYRVIVTLNLPKERPTSPECNRRSHDHRHHHVHHHISQPRHDLSPSRVFRTRSGHLLASSFSSFSQGRWDLMSR